jgi:hypothetical protein
MPGYDVYWLRMAMDRQVLATPIPTDHFICRMIVDPPIRDEAGRPIARHA